MTPREHEEARIWLRLTGIEFVQLGNPAWFGCQYHCRSCNLHWQEACRTDGSEKPSEVIAALERNFAEHAAARACPHWPRFVALREDAAAVAAVRTLAKLMTALPPLPEPSQPDYVIDARRRRNLEESGIDEQTYREAMARCYVRAGMNPPPEDAGPRPGLETRQFDGTPGELCEYANRLWREGQGRPLIRCARTGRYYHLRVHADGSKEVVEAPLGPLAAYGADHPHLTGYQSSPARGCDLAKGGADRPLYVSLHNGEREVGCFDPQTGCVTRLELPTDASGKPVREVVDQLLELTGCAPVDWEARMADSDAE